MEQTHATPTIYYSGVYWNSYEYAWEELNARISGDRRRQWFQHFQARVGGRRFKKALILCCGNGWVEREMYEHGLFEEAVGVDYADALLDQARAARPDWPLRYYRMDINTAAFPEGGFDLIVNHAAAHHITALDHVFRTLAASLPDDGYFISYDYVGPHRNQYSLLHWAAVHALNDSLPEQLRQDLEYPDLPTMLADDPTEAIHSELILPVMRRYFAIEEQRHAGGALAYLLLTHNQRFHAAPEPERSRWLRHILEADAAYLAAFPESSLFDYVAARPARAAFDDPARLTLWSGEEALREQLARRRGGYYYTPAAEYGQAPAAPLDLQPLVDQLRLGADELRQAGDELRGEADELRGEADKLRREADKLRRECAWRRTTMERLVAERSWMRQRLAELEQAWGRVEANPLVALWRRLRRGRLS